MSYYLPNTNRAPIAHATFSVSDFAQSRPFYTATFAALGWDLVHDGAEYGFIAYGPGYLAVGLNEKKGKVTVAGPGDGTHVAFEAPSKQAVIDWYNAAIAHGGTGNGEPGLRPHYSPNYFAAFVLDPDGHRIEAVCHMKKEDDQASLDTA